MALTASPVAANGAPVVIGPDHEEGRDLIADCGSFQALDQFSIDFSLKLFFDADGNLIRGVEAVYGTDTFVNSVNGKQIASRFHNSVQIDFVAGLGASPGIIFRLIVPGLGVVFLDVGRITTNQGG